MPSARAEKRTNGHHPLFLYQAASSFGNGAASPFIPYFATRLDATTIHLGWLQALSNLFPNALQIPWGRLSDRTRQRVGWIIAGSFLAALAFGLLALAFDPITVIVIVSFHAVAASVIAPTWSALLGDRVPEQRRGRVFSWLVVVGSVAGLVGTLVTAFLVLANGPTSSDVFRLPFLVGAAATVGGATVLFLIPRAQWRVAAAGRRLTDGEEREAAADFRYFVRIQGTYNFFMSLIWPLIAITTIRILGATNFEIVVFTLLGTLSTIAFQPFVGRLVDRVGPAQLITASRAMFVVVPLFYAFATSVWHLYVLNVFIGWATAVVNVAFAAYILDVAPEPRRAEYFSLYNTVIGIVTFGGAILGGYLAATFEVLWGDLWTALLAVYLVSFVGRALATVPFLKLRSPRRYPETLGAVVREWEARLHVPWRH